MLACVACQLVREGLGTHKPACARASVLLARACSHACAHIAYGFGAYVYHEIEPIGRRPIASTCTLGILEGLAATEALCPQLLDLRQELLLDDALE